MLINVKDNLTLQIYAHYFPSSRPIAGGWEKADGWHGAPSPDAWWQMMEWARKNSIVCRRGRGTDVIFEREEDITAFMLRWS
jgi:hypothetical protein